MVKLYVYYPIRRNDMVPNAGANFNLIIIYSNKICTFQRHPYSHHTNASNSLYPRCAAQNSIYFVSGIIMVYLFRWNTPTPITKCRALVEIRNSYRSVGCSLKFKWYFASYVSFHYTN
jgi:hypothetical protein